MNNHLKDDNIIEIAVLMTNKQKIIICDEVCLTGMTFLIRILRKYLFL